MNNHKISENELTEATLFITLYINRQQKEIANKLVNYLSSEPSPLIPFDMPFKAWQNQEETKFLFYFDIPTTSDTSVIQLVLNDDQAVKTAWDAMYKKLIGILADQTLKAQVGFADDQLLRELGWGYSLVYQARLATENSIDLSTADLDNLLPAIRSPSIPEDDTPYPLAKTQIADNWLWLLDIPDDDDGLAAGMVYLALNPTEAEANYFDEQVLVGPVATFLMPDLIAHKGYHEMRQYQPGSIIKDYNQQLKYLRGVAGQMLSQIKPAALGLSDEMLKQVKPEQLGLPAGSTIEAKDMPTQYGYVVGTRLPSFDDLRVAIARQLDNYQQWWQKDTAENAQHQPILKELGDDEILAYHQSKLQTAYSELQLLVDEGNNAINAVRAAVEATRTQAELRREQQQRWFDLLLIAIGTGLATAQIVDANAAKALLYWVALSSVDPTNRLHQLGMQFLVTILVIGLVAGLWKLHKRA
ncbi:hypothetical protein QUF58_13865 [Anaerolineales bacterium HSG24]|nr:hypothetical protein [Anaerolineales bacterium HSG24]